MIKAIITDFDGTLADTFEANFKAYEKAFNECGEVLTKEQYMKCFGMRYDCFMQSMGIGDAEKAERIREMKKNYYPEFFGYIKLNKTLIDLLETMKSKGIKTAIASTARKENLYNVLNFYNLERYFDFILAGADVEKGKPNPEIYIKTMAALDVTPSETLIFEDSEVGVKAAVASGTQYIRVTKEWF